jgi:hypothetical protein
MQKRPMLIKQSLAQTCDSMAGMTGWREPQEPAAIPKAIRLRERARSLKAQAEGLLKKADDLLAEAEQVEAKESKK